MTMSSKSDDVSLGTANQASIEWTPGQKAVIGRRTIVTIDRVTPSGRVIVGDRTFNPDGIERGVRDFVRLEPFTAEIEAEIDLVERGRKAAAAIDNAEDAIRRMGRLASPWGNRTPDAADVEQAERLANAIQEVFSGKHT